MWSLQTWPASNSGVGYLYLDTGRAINVPGIQTVLHSALQPIADARWVVQSSSGSINPYSLGAGPFCGGKDDGLPLARSPLLPGHQHRRGNCDRGISSDENTNYQGK